MQSSERSSAAGRIKDSMEHNNKEWKRKKSGIFIIKETFKITISLKMGNTSYC